jgi:hypothetical protein
MTDTRTQTVLSASLFLLLSQVSSFAQQLVFFGSPTKNINCMYMPTQPPNPPYTKVSADAYIRCDIMQFTPTLKSVPQQSKEDIEIFGKCTVAKMKAFIIQEKGVQTKSYCPTDVPISEGQFVLDYAKSFTRGGLTCVSQMNGMTCQNELGHGFFLSRSLQRLF